MKPAVIGDFSVAKSYGERWSRKDGWRERNWELTFSACCFAKMRIPSNCWKSNSTVMRTAARRSVS